MSIKTYKQRDLEIKADFAQASSPILFRNVGDEDWRPTVFQVAKAGHDRQRAFQLVREWAEYQS